MRLTGFCFSNFVLGGFTSVNITLLIRKSARDVWKVRSEQRFGEACSTRKTRERVAVNVTPAALIVCAAVSDGRANKVLRCHQVTLLGVAPQTPTATLQKSPHKKSARSSKSCMNPVFYCTKSGVGRWNFAAGQKNTKAFTVRKKFMELGDLAN